MCSFKSSLIKEEASGSGSGGAEGPSANSTLLKEASQTDLNAISLADDPETESQETSQLNQSKEPAFTLEIAAIDNGLAFPMKHPDEWRACNHKNKK